MPQQFTDNARALLTSGIGAGDLSLTVEAAKADRFPSANTTNWATPLNFFKLVLIDSAGNREVIKVGTRSLGSAVLGNILRGQDGTVARAFTTSTTVIGAFFAQDATDMNATIAANNVAQNAVIAAAVNAINSNQLAGMRNRIINGACDIAQRPSFVALSGSNGYGGPDRFYADNSLGGGQFTQSPSTLTFAGALRNSVRQTVNVATTAFTTTNHWAGIQQRIEGFNSYDLKGKPVAVSFIFNTNLTGTYSVALRDGANGQSHVATFSATANTPVKVSVPIAAIPLAAAVPLSNALGLSLSVGFINQATYQTATLNAWQAGNFASASTASNWAATAGNFIELTELQLEDSTAATPFERRSFAAELAMCQRYYEERTVLWATAVAASMRHFNSSLVQKRASPNLVCFQNSTKAASGVVFNETASVNISASVGGSETANGFGISYLSPASPSNMSAHITASAEL